MRFIVCAATALLLSACSSIDLDPVAPPGFDLTGRWQINPELSDMPPGPRAQSSIKTDRPIRSRRAARRAYGGAISFLVQDFPVVAASTLDIEQNRGSMGVDFDKGDYRDVSWGYRERGIWQIWAGWEEGVLVIVSEAKDMKARETITLEPGGQRMVVNLAVEANLDLQLTRVFDRIE